VLCDVTTTRQHNNNTTTNIYLSTMVLAELGGKLRDSLRKLHSTQGRVTEKQLNQVLSEITRALIEADVNVKLVMTLRDNVKTKVQSIIDQEDKDPNDSSEAAVAHRASNVSKTVQRAVVDELTSLLSPNKKPYILKRGKPNVILFVGLQGAGKTTTIAKFANYYQRRGWKTAMVCADTFRAGAFDQLKQNATKLRVPFYGSYTQADPVAIAEEGVDQFESEGYEVIIVDTSGRHRQEAGLLEEMQEIAAAVRPDNTILVMDATQGQSCFDQASAFSAAVDVGSVIITKLDGHAKGGGALSAVAATESPIIFLGSGEHFDDLDPFNAQSFVSKLLGFGDVRGLMEAMKSADDGKSQEELMEKMSKGVFTLRDMYSQFQRVMNMGPLNKVMGMMPGMPDYLIPKTGDGDESTNRLKKFLFMMDSMTAAELDGKVDFSSKEPHVESRIHRIAAGSGTHPKEVQMLLQVHKQFEGMVSKMGKSGMMGKNAQAKQQQMAAQMRKNPQLINQRLNQMDPRMLQQMGGREAVAAMMQQMAKGGGAGGAGGMPNMEALMGGAAGGGGGGMPDMSGMQMPSGGMQMPAGMGGMDMNAIMKMAQSMGGMPSMGGAPPGAGRR
jgi:signal recognition particle subunit SRP54